jgi:hypothetical protein
VRCLGEDAHLLAVTFFGCSNSVQKGVGLYLTLLLLVLQ